MSINKLALAMWGLSYAQKEVIATTQQLSQEIVASQSVDPKWASAQKAKIGETESQIAWLKKAMDEALEKRALSNDNAERYKLIQSIRELEAEIGKQTKALAELKQELPQMLPMVEDDAEVIIGGGSTVSGSSGGRRLSSKERTDALIQALMRAMTAPGGSLYAGGGGSSHVERIAEAAAERGAAKALNAYQRLSKAAGVDGAPTVSRYGFDVSLTPTFFKNLVDMAAKAARKGSMMDVAKLENMFNRLSGTTRIGADFFTLMKQAMAIMQSTGMSGGGKR